MRLLRYLLFPIVPIYWLVTWVRNAFYNSGQFSSKSYDIPIICVGNLSTGGTGKTPMVEYLIALLKPHYKIATLSRGYKRKTSGFVLADNSTTTRDIGDEPYQLYKNHPDIKVAVDENRQRGIENLMARKDSPEVILLDDAFQHRKVRAGFNILLTAFDNLYSTDIVLPTGNLREPRSGANRADVVVVTKCPQGMPDSDKALIASSLKLNKNQDLFFSYIEYSNSIHNSSERLPVETLADKNFTLVTGIANPASLVNYLQTKNFRFQHLKYADHHEFSDRELSDLNKREIILTTEKDFVRLHGKLTTDLYYLPIKIRMDRQDVFNKKILEFCR